MGLGKLDILMEKIKTRSLSVTLYKKTNSKWMKGLNVRPETLKLLVENIGETLQVLGLGIDFLSRSPIAQEIIV
jgi:hypothetical protein